MSKQSDTAFDPDGWDRMAAGRAGGAAWIFERAIERVAELAGTPGPGETRLLDVGCGTGRLALRLREAGWDVTGIDADPAMIRHAAARLGAERVRHADAAALPFSDGAFDRITATSLLGCLEEPDRFLAEAHRCLAPGGALVLTATNRDSLLLKLNYALPRAWVVPAAAGSRRRFATYTRHELCGRLAAAGFRVDPCHGFNFALHVGPMLFPGRGVARGLDGLGINGALRRWARNWVAVGWREA